MSYTHLWLDVVAGLKKEGWKIKGGNYTNWILLTKEDQEIKVFIKDYKKLRQDDLNFICVRYT